MVDVDIVTAKLTELYERLERIRDRCPDDLDSLVADRDAFEVVSFNLVLAVQACLDIASHLIGDEGWPAATSLAESILRLHEHGVLSEATARAVAPAAGMRNILVHVYSSVDPAKVYRAAVHDVDHLESFGREVATWLREKAS